MKYLVEICPDESKLTSLVDYFRHNYVESIKRNKKKSSSLKFTIGKKKPRYPIDEWNLHEAIVNGTSRTNNFCESWNNGFFYLMDKQM